ncbi:GNAT family N-acetyltransferase [Rhodococcus sp. BS-15]|uniref:GNAT family N-acetyltransferase n=1 Tax=Rhodococcus sp. BS-15 TaxID=1304954 RepID=UPI000FFBFD06|nr:GNAT family N-acetyltransferase [Rhodococcus sp. BS-15]
MTSVDSEDAGLVAELVRLVFEPFRAQFEPTAMRWTAEAIADRPDDWLVLRRDGLIVGAVRHGVDNEGYTFDSLSVDPAVRRQGIGRSLVAAVRVRAMEAGAHQLIVAVRHALSGNVAFVGACGFVRSRNFSADHDVYVAPLSAQVRR